MSKSHPKELQDQMVALFKSGKSASGVAKMLGLQTTSVTRVLKRHGCEMTDGKGPNHSGWKGGRGLKTGYMTVYKPEHHRANNIRRVFEHILIMEEMVGRPIQKGEPIHHVDLDRTNNTPSNLYLFANHKEHQAAHKSLDDCARELIKKGVIGFAAGRYFLR